MESRNRWLSLVSLFGVLGVELAFSDNPQGQPAIIDSSAQSLTVSIGFGGGSPAEVHAFREMGQVFPISEVISPEIVANYWKKDAAQAVEEAKAVAKALAKLKDMYRDLLSESNLPPK